MSCVTLDSKTNKARRFWLHRNKSAKEELVKHLVKYEHIIGYQCVAEARSFYSLNLEPLSFKWVDLFLEYRMLTNHNERLSWGNQLVNGKVKFIHKPKPKWERTEEDGKMGFKATHSLAEATYKLTGEIRDTEEKTKVRDLIISDPKRFTPGERERILQYNEDDVKHLPTIWKRVKEEYAELLVAESLDWGEYFDDCLTRGRYSAHTAIMESIGYPINYEATKNFAQRIPSILAECQRDINLQFKKTKPNEVMARLRGKTYKEVRPFRWNAKKADYSWNQKETRQWLTDNVNTRRWMRTEKQQLSLALEAWEREFNYKHDYPRGNFGAQMVRYLKLKQSLSGFSSSGGRKRKSFWNNVGPDQRVRPYMNIYGAQSGRSQPASTGFMFLKPAWMRALVAPKPGYFLAGIDFGQQEFFLAALLSGDENMIAAYLSGDPYLYQGKQAGTIPQTGTRKTHEHERDLMKSTTLGILFGMTKVGLAIKLTQDSGKHYTEDQAQDLIEAFGKVYPDYISWREEEYAKYDYGEAISTLDGWKLWVNNDNPRSVLNVPVQGGGASIMRKSVDLAVDDGCRVIFTLHDAIYIEGKVGQEKHILHLRNAMREGFSYFFEGTPYEKFARKIKLDPKAWGPHFPDKGEIVIDDLKVPVSKLYIDSRAQADYERFCSFFEPPDSKLL